MPIQTDFFKYNINKFIFSLQKDVYPFESMDDWEIFNKPSLPEDFYIHINMEDITITDYMHAKSLQRFRNNKFRMFKAIHYC